MKAKKKKKYFLSLFYKHDTVGFKHIILVLIKFEIFVENNWNAPPCFLCKISMLRLKTVSLLENEKHPRRTFKCKEVKLSKLPAFKTNYTTYFPSLWMCQTVQQQ